MRILVTGATGNVGRLVVDQLLGTGVEITTLPGYLPLAPNDAMVKLYGGNAEKLVDPGDINPDLGHRSGSTDMGDLSQIMPTIHPYVVAASGNGHGIDYIVEDYDLAVLTGAKAMAMTVIDLLAHGAERARNIKADYQAPHTKATYLALMRSMFEERAYTE